MTDTFETLSTAALLGTARSAPAPATLHTSDAAAALTGDPASRLLAAAALESAFLTAATLPTVRTLPEPAPDDDRLTLPAAAADRLRGLLVVRSPLLPEWFALAERFRAPHEIVVDLLWFAAPDTPHRKHLLRLAGVRGQWVAAQNPAWSHLVTPDPSDERPWLHGSPLQRRRWFAVLRASNPHAATERLTASWSSETAAQRGALLELLADGLGAHDEALLEQALDDRSRKVRPVALDLLRRLPDSAFAARMTRRVREWTRVAGDELVVDVPNRLDGEALRDGVDDGASRTGGEKMRRLTAVASSAPPAAWQHLAPTPEQILALRVDEPVREALDAGWTAAVAVHRDGDWARAFLRRDGTADTAVAQALPRQMLVSHLLGSSGRALLDPALLGALAAPWPRDLAEKVLIALYREGGTGIRSFQTIITLIAHRAPFELTELLADAATRTDHLDRLNLFATAADTLTLRRTLHEELS
ncbi:DUF5691 domain-containing protein [Rhodococcus coprophilus]|uniref:Uncharacterized protein n=1 Tax=Rhodococcus coprophilus TaxID=38310 RepID=A0A2X4TLG7_9NOCA|nr:DUF5691 domain-containing protein [Rhodococcus coprophilus]MBM7460568.1 hypothetical protein [Rhodococcus coprophilus]SQI28377.1 Uncharacterised protein [Rhodococcus coprophilus]